jgi:hypothetical protein
VQGLKGILADRTELEIYSTLLDCGMDPDVAVERLISQGIGLTGDRRRPTPSLPSPTPAVWNSVVCCGAVLRRR